MQRVKGALQLLSKRYRSIRLAHVPERISISSSDGDHQRFIIDLPMKPEKNRSKWLRSRNWNRRSLWVAAAKSSVQFEYEKAVSIYLGLQGTFDPMSGTNCKREHGRTGSRTHRHGDTAGISGDTVGIPEAPLRYPHPVVGHASVGARASCPLIPSHSCVYR